MCRHQHITKKLHNQGGRLIYIPEPESFEHLFEFKISSLQTNIFWWFDFDKFQELGRLLPDYRFDLLLIGPHISKKVHKTEATYDNMTLRLHRGLYHNYDGTTPDVAIGNYI